MPSTFNLSVQRPRSLASVFSHHIANMMPGTSPGFVAFFAWFIGHGLLGSALEWVVGGDVLVYAMVASVPSLLWVRSMWRVWLLRRVHRGARLTGLLWGMGLAAAPVPLFWFFDMFRRVKPLKVMISLWVVAFFIASFVLGSLIQALARGVVERAVLKADAEGQRAWLVSASSPRRLPARWLNVRVSAALCVWVGGVSALVAKAPTVTSALLASGAVVFGVVSARAWCLPQARAVMSAWLTSADLLLSSIVASLCAMTLTFHALGRVPVAKSIGVAVGLLLVAVFAQAPTWLIRRDRRNWRAVWEDRLALALPSHGAHLVRRGYEGDPPSAVTLGVNVAFPSGSVNPFVIRARAAVVDPLVITGDPDFDARFYISADEDLGRALLTAPTRALIMGLHPLGLEVGASRVLCVVPFPWQAQAPAQSLSAVADALNPSFIQAWAAYIDERLLEAATQDPCLTARVLAAQSLIARWKDTAWERLRAHLGHDAPSLALLDALSLKRPPSEWASRLQDLAPWPAQGDGFAQALWSLGAQALFADPAAFAAVTPPKGRLALLDPFLASEVAYAALSHLTPAWEPWLLDALARVAYPSHGLSLCQALAKVGGLSSISPLRALARQETTPAHVRDAAQSAITDISARVDTSGTEGGLSLMDTSTQGDLALTDPKE